MEIAVLLSLMIGSSAEDFQLYLSFWRGVKEIKLESDVLLENVKNVIKQIKVSTSALLSLSFLKVYFSIAFTQCELLFVFSFKYCMSAFYRTLLGPMKMVILSILY